MTSRPILLKSSPSLHFAYQACVYFQFYIISLFVTEKKAIGGGPTDNKVIQQGFRCLIRDTHSATLKHKTIKSY